MLSACRAPARCPPPASSALPAASFSGTAVTNQQQSSRRVQRQQPRHGPLLVAPTAAAPQPPAGDAASEEAPVWRYLRVDQGFDDSKIRSLRKYAGEHVAALSEAEVQRDLASICAALRAEGLDTVEVQQLFVAEPGLLLAPHACAAFSSNLAVLRQLAERLPEDSPYAQYAPAAQRATAGATRLGAVLHQCQPLRGAAQLLCQQNLGSHIAATLEAHAQLGISCEATAKVLLQDGGILVTDAARAQAMVAHLQAWMATGTLLEDEVYYACLQPTGLLSLERAEFDRRLVAGWWYAYMGLGRKIGLYAGDLGELLQAADGAPLPLQPRYREEAVELLYSSDEMILLVTSKPPSSSGVRAAWSDLRSLGLTASQLARAVRLRPGVLALDWAAGGPAATVAAWLQQEMQVPLVEAIDLMFVSPHWRVPADASVARAAMRAGFLRAHDPGVWADTRTRVGALLDLLTISDGAFGGRIGCTQDELAEFERGWLASPAGQRWGKQPGTD